MDSYAEAVTRAAHSVDQLWLEAVIDFSAQPPDQHLEHICEWIVVLIPNALGNGSAREHSVLIAHQYLEQLPLFSGQRDRFTAALDPPAAQIDDQVSNRALRIDERRLAPGKCPNAGEELLES